MQGACGGLYQCAPGWGSSLVTAISSTGRWAGNPASSVPLIRCTCGLRDDSQSSTGAPIGRLLTNNVLPVAVGL